MAGFAWMHEKSGGPGAGQRSGNLVADMPRFTHTGDDDAALAIQNHLASVIKRLIDAFDQCENGFGFGL